MTSRLNRNLQHSCKLPSTTISVGQCIPRRQSLPISSIRHASTALHFYQNRQLDLYSSREAKRLTLRQLTFFGRSMDEDRLIKSANYVRTELPVRIAHRIRDMHSLPYVVVTQEGVARVYELYWDAFEKFRKYPPIHTLKENDEFCHFVAELLSTHSSVIPNLSLGLSLSSPYLSPDQLDSFMHRMLSSRISRRVLAEHHIALSKAFAGEVIDHEEEKHVGIIYTALNVRRSIEKCTSLLRARKFTHDGATPSQHGGGNEPPNNVQWPQVIIEGHVQTNFSYIKEHLEYIIFELLKNAMRATALKYYGAPTLPPIKATVVSNPNEIGIRISDQGGGLSSPHISSPSDLFSFSHVRNSGRMEQTRLGALRTVSSSESGLRATLNEQIGRWQNAGPLAPHNPLSVDAEEQLKSSPEEKAGVGTHYPIGIGLPMSNIFTTYFGGSLELVSLDGWGTDVYLRLPKLGTKLEGIEV